jgi:hypothetical protein
MPGLPARIALSALRLRSRPGTDRDSQPLAQITIDFGTQSVASRVYVHNDSDPSR